MVVLILESVSPSLRGELSRWMLEPKAGVFVGTLSGTVRDLLWEKACMEVGEGGCTMIHRAANEQGFAIRSYGDTTRQVEEWEGLFLVRRPIRQPDPQPVPIDWSEMLHPEVWAKSPVKADGSGAYHPLICHMIDTAMVALRLWQYVLPAALKEQITAGLGVSSVEDAGRWIAFFAGLHDLGKATPPFARQWDDGWRRLHKEKYGPARSSDKKPHQILTSYLLPDLLEEVGIPRSLAEAVAVVVGGHHGLFPSAAQLEHGNRFAGDGLWAKARSNLVRVLAHVMQVGRLAPPTGDLAQQQGGLVVLAGLTSVADWIASDHNHFPFAGDDVRLPSYARRSRWRAWMALYKLGWFHGVRSLEPRTFQELFDRVPNRLQEQVLAVAPELDGPSLILLEYPMGGGKTEGALYLADYLAAMAGQRGAYFALPTMATSNQMFGRVGKYLTNRFPDSHINVQLLHGHSDLHAEFARLKQAGAATELVRPSGVSGGTGSGLLAAEWFTYRKRGLLAPYGIGTIDQALLSVLQTKHFFVRLFGLAGKVVILDEVHAYDTYMRTLMTQLLSWLAACGTSVVLLSATLPSRTRAELLAAYATGRGQGLSPDMPAAAYPRISWVTEGGAGSRHITGAPERSVALRQLSQADPAWMEDLKEALADGGCAAVIVNTVTRAQQVYQQLKQHFQPDELYLFHARFPFDDRFAREQTVLELFGPGTANRPHRAVVVATQVIEQSLDLDFDVMVTDLAPVDLLLQRSGRLWRHGRSWRPGTVVMPTLRVLMPPSNQDGIPLFEPGAARVYDPHTLLRTWLTLTDRDTVQIPGDMEELVEAVYQAVPAPPEMPEALARFWSASRAKLEQTEEKDQGTAEKRYIPKVGEGLFGMGMVALDEEDETLHQAHQAMTRLGGPSVSVVCLIQQGGRLTASPDCHKAIRLEKRPEAEDLRTLLGRSLRISFAPGLVRRILSDEVPVPETWQGTAHLRRHRLLVFSPEGACLTANLPLRLDPELGLMQVTAGEEEEM